MKYNLDDLHWQEFELLAFKVLQILVSPNVQFIEGGNDKGRDVVFEGISDFNSTYNGKWIFQVKHKSKASSDSEIAYSLVYDLKNELEKVFLINKLQFDNYILVTNKPVNGEMFDRLHDEFESFKDTHKIECSHFSLISYRHIESCIDDNDSLKWTYPNIISSPDFLNLLQEALTQHIENRSKGWLNTVNKHRQKFVFTTFFEKAFRKLTDYPAIILSGPPKSGKTFNAEILALNFSLFEYYQPILVDEPDEIEKVYKPERKQIFICDDAFGKYSLFF